MTLPTAFDRLVGSYYTDTSHYDAANKWFPDASGMGNNWPLVQASGTPTFNTRGSMPCLDLFPIGVAYPPFFQMPWPGYVDCSVVMAIRQKGTSPTTRSVLHAALTSYFVGEDYAGGLPLGDLTGSDSHALTACHASTTAALPACTYANGASGVGATLTANANGALPAQDGVTLSATNRLLVQNQGAPHHLQNGAYTVTQVGDASNPFILTRATDCDTSAEISGGVVQVSAGTTLANKFFQFTPYTYTIGTDTIFVFNCDAQIGNFDDAGLYVSNARVPTVTSWNASGSVADAALVDDTWTIIQGIWSADGWRRIRTNLGSWVSSQSVASHRGIVGGGRLRLGWMVNTAGPITVVGEYCSVGEIHFVSDDLFTNQTETLDAVVTSLKTKYGIP
jgi:hypothetical protein